MKRSFFSYNNIKELLSKIGGGQAFFDILEEFASSDVMEMLKFHRKRIKKLSKRLKQAFSQKQFDRVVRYFVKLLKEFFTMCFKAAGLPLSQVMLFIKLVAAVFVLLFILLIIKGILGIKHILAEIDLAKSRTAFYVRESQRLLKQMNLMDLQKKLDEKKLDILDKLATSGDNDLEKGVAASVIAQSSITLPLTDSINVKNVALGAIKVIIFVISMGFAIKALSLFSKAIDENKNKAFDTKDGKKAVKYAVLSLFLLLGPSVFTVLVKTFKRFKQKKGK